MRAAISTAVLAVVFVMGGSPAAQALTITPSTDVCGSPTCLSATGNQTSQPQIDAAIAAFIGSATEVYKQNVGGSETGTFAGSYVTTFSDTPSDPSDALIDYQSGPVINGSSIFLLVKDGDQTPAWYLFNISNWNGTDDIVLENFWPNEGAISHVTIYSGGTRVPDGGSTALLLGTGLIAMASLRRRFAR